MAARPGECRTDDTSQAAQAIECRAGAHRPWRAFSLAECGGVWVFGGLPTGTMTNGGARALISPDGPFRWRICGRCRPHGPGICASGNRPGDHYAPLGAHRPWRAFSQCKAKSDNSGAMSEYCRSSGVRSGHLACGCTHQIACFNACRAASSTARAPVASRRNRPARQRICRAPMICPVIRRDRLQIGTKTCTQGKRRVRREPGREYIGLPAGCSPAPAGMFAWRTKSDKSGACAPVRGDCAGGATPIARVGRPGHRCVQTHGRRKSRAGPGSGWRCRAPGALCRNKPARRKTLGRGGPTSRQWPQIP